VGNVFTSDNDGAPPISSLNTTTELPAELFVLVSTNTLRSCGAATAIAVANNAATSTVPVSQRVDFRRPVKFILISFEVCGESLQGQDSDPLRQSSSLTGIRSATWESYGLHRQKPMLNILKFSNATVTFLLFPANT
jgi:hypothetical protein